MIIKIIKIKMMDDLPFHVTRKEKNLTVSTKNKKDDREDPFSSRLNLPRHIVPFLPSGSHRYQLPSLLLDHVKLITGWTLPSQVQFDSLGAPGWVPRPSTVSTIHPPPLLPPYLAHLTHPTQLTPDQLWTLRQVLPFIVRTCLNSKDSNDRWRIDSNEGISTTESLGVSVWSIHRTMIVHLPDLDHLFCRWKGMSTSGKPSQRGVSTTVVIQEDRMWFHVESTIYFIERWNNDVRGWTRTDEGDSTWYHIHRIPTGWTYTLSHRSDTRPWDGYEMVERFDENTLERWNFFQRFGVQRVARSFQTRIDKVSQAMMSDGCGLRYRGKHRETIDSTTGRLLSQSLVNEDTKQVLFQEDSQTGVTVDHLNKGTTRPTVGWKVACHPETRKMRIVKLHIPESSRIVTPVDETLTIHRGKMRCSEAEVIDIQLPTKEVESVVNSEREAISCVYASTPCVYRLGSVVRPSSFSDDIHQSCAPGIHFFSCRDVLFETYLSAV